MGSPRHVRPGEPVLAEHHNAVVEELRSLRATLGAAGLGIPAAAARLALAGIMLPAFVVEIHVPPGAPGPGYPVRDVRYTIASRHGAFENWGPVTPAVGAPVRRDSDLLILPAAVGDDAFVLRSNVGDGGVRAELWILSERLLVRGCPSTIAPPDTPPNPPLVPLPPIIVPGSFTLPPSPAAPMLPSPRGFGDE